MSDFSQTRHGYSPEEVDSYIHSMKMEYENRLAVQKERIFELVERNKKAEEELESYRKKDDEISSALLGAVAKAKDIEQEAELRYENELNRLQVFHAKWVRYYNEIRTKYPLDDDLLSVEKFLTEMNRILGSDAEIARGEQPKIREPEREDFTEKRKDFLTSYKNERARIMETEKSKREASKTAEKSAVRNDSEKRFLDLIGKYEKQSDADTSMPFDPLDRIKDYIDSTAQKASEEESGFDMREIVSPSKKLDLAELCKELGLMDGDK